MKRIKPKKSVKWCARVRMYGETYEEKLLAPLRVETYLVRGWWLGAN